MSVMRSILLALLVALGAAADDVPCASEKWGYGSGNGPDNWGQMEVAWKACDGGAAQSPIALVTNTPGTSQPSFRLSYVNGPLVVQRTNVELKVPTVRGTLNFGIAVVNAQLDQLHFHVPSEHTVNGKTYAAEMHLVHQLGNRIYVAAVLIDDVNVTTTNAALQAILDLKPGSSCSSRRRPENFDPTTLLPSLVSFWTYGGSLTTPACAEGVTFFVIYNPIKATKTQIDALRITANARPLQGLGTRTVQKNFTSGVTP